MDRDLLLKILEKVKKIRTALGVLDSKVTNTLKVVQVSGEAYTISAGDYISGALTASTDTQEGYTPIGVVGVSTGNIRTSLIAFELLANKKVSYSVLNTSSGEQTGTPIFNILYMKN